MTEEMKWRYTVLVQFLGEALGPNYEVVLQEINGENSGIIAIANGGISGRRVGSPITAAALRMIVQRQYENSNYKLSYTGRLANGKRIRSSTMFIKDRGELVGLLCVNFDDSRFHELSDELLRLVHPDNFIGDEPAAEPAERSAESAELFQSSAAALAQEIFDEVSRAVELPMDRLTQEERQTVISMLCERGFFELKGAVQFAAERLGCSQASIYRYLNRAKGV